MQLRFAAVCCIAGRRTQKVKEAAISYSPHAYVPKRTLTEEERVVLYRTRIDASFKPYTVIDVLQKVYK